MARNDPVPGPLLVESFNADLERLSSPARLAITALCEDADVFEPLDDEGEFVTLLPASNTPEVPTTA